jgi:hypothetical protein
MTATITDIMAYSKRDGLDKVAARRGEYDSTGGSVTIFSPYELLHGGPARDEPFTLAFDMAKQPVTLKRMRYDGVIPHTDSLFFVAQATGTNAEKPERAEGQQER